MPDLEHEADRAPRHSIQRLVGWSILDKHLYGVEHEAR
jgi:hypothetical protein